MEPFSVDAPIAAECPWPKRILPAHAHAHARPPEPASGPAYVNAPPQPNAIESSAKALGIVSAFFGMVFMIGATAGILSGKLSLESPAQAWRGLFVFALGASSLAIGALLLHQKPARQ